MNGGPDPFKSCCQPRQVSQSQSGFDPVQLDHRILETFHGPKCSCTRIVYPLFGLKVVTTWAPWSHSIQGFKLRPCELRTATQSLRRRCTAAVCRMRRLPKRRLRRVRMAGASSSATASYHLSTICIWSTSGIATKAPDARIDIVQMSQLDPFQPQTGNCRPDI